MTALGHVKWFVDSEKVIAASHNTTPFYYLTSKEVIIWSIISVFVVLVFSVLDRLVPFPKAILAFGEKHKNKIDKVAAKLFGLFLVTVSLVWHLVLVPDLPINSSLTYILGICEVLLGIMFIFYITPFVTSCAFVCLYFSLVFLTPPLVFFENIMMLTIGLYFLIRNAPFGSFLSQLDKHSVEIVRVGTGISLIIFAFTEKLSYPELGLSFLEIHHWNFMYNIGFTWFTDKLFVLSTGFAEMIFGIIFILGYLTRINTILIASFFAMSVVTMAVGFGQWEVEDLVVYVAAILFVFYGHGKTKFFYYFWPESVLHTKNIKGLFKYLFFKV